ncbi:MAG: hypothetical protein ACYS1E_02985 [Planctomycetota bacterium]
MRIVLSIAAVGCLAGIATGQPVVTNFSGGSAFDSYYGTPAPCGDVVGFRFTSDVDQTVLELGCLNDDGDGVMDSAHQVGLWRNSDQALLAEVTVTPASPLVGQWRYEPVAPVLIEAGVQYTLGAMYASGDGDSYYSGPSSMGLFQISDTNGVYPLAGDLCFVYPENDSTNLARLGPNAIVGAAGPSGGCCQCDALGAQFCTVESEDNCDSLGGEYLGDDTDCDGGDCAIDFPDQCTPLGACCQCDDIVPFCTMETQDDCAALNGDYIGDFVLCSSDPCDPDGCLGVDVSVDIRPGGCNNPFNRASNGVLKVAVAGSDDFDVLGIDVSTVKIWRLDGVGGAVGPNFGPPGPAPRFGDATDSFMGDLCECDAPRNPDGILDLIVKFRSSDVTEVLELGDLPAGLIVPLCVGGDMLDGTAFEGCDCAWLVGTDGSAGMVNLESNLVDIWVKSNPADDYEDEGGFTNFSRFYPLGTEIVFKAPLVPSMHSNLILRGWWVNGEFRKDLREDVTITLDTPFINLSPLYGVNFLRPSTPDSDSGSDGTAAH